MAVSDIRFKGIPTIKAMGDNVLKVLASFKANIEVKDCTKPSAYTTFYVIDNASDCILSRETALRMELLMIGIKVKSNQKEIFQFAEKILTKTQRFPTIPMYPVELEIDKSIVPKKVTTNRIPLAYKARVNERLREMEAQGIIEATEWSTPWISALEVVPKKSAKGNDFRVVEDMRNANKAIMRKMHRLPDPNQIWAQFDGAKWFTKLDISSAYHHVELHPNSRYITAFMTDNGVMQFTRLNFGLNVAPEIFQSIMDRLFKTSVGTVVYLDDILIYAKTLEDLNEQTKEVLIIIDENNLTLNKEKCLYNVQRIDFLGCVIDENGVQAAPEKVEAIKNFIPPTNTTELRSFLGLVNFVGQFVPNLATSTWPLSKLLTPGKNQIEWHEEQQNAFENIKCIIERDIISRGHFDVNDATALYTDASPVGIGAVLTQQDKNLVRRIVAVASKTLTNTEKAYPQVQREALAIAWAVEKYFYYLLGLEEPFTLYTDHDALKFLYKSYKSAGARAISRAEAWNLKLDMYNFKVGRVSSKENIADPLSRMIKQKDEAFEDETIDEKYIFHVSNALADTSKTKLALSWRELQEATQKDDELQMIFKAIKSEVSWPKEIAKLEAFKEEFFDCHGILVRAERIVVPNDLRKKALQIAHQSHPGITTMKTIIRQSLWWPGLSKDVENYVKSCKACVQVTKTKYVEVFVSSVMPNGPWQKLSVDFLTRPELDAEILVIVDYYSRYLVAIPIVTNNATLTIQALEQTFDVLGYPSSIKSDNGSPFQSAELERWSKSRNIKWNHSIKRNAQENGIVERQMQGITKRLKIAKILNDEKGVKQSLKKALIDYVANYNTWPHSTTGKAPAAVLFNREIKGMLPKLNEKARSAYDDDIRDEDAVNKFEKRKYALLRRHAKPSNIEIGDVVLIKNEKIGKLQPKYSSIEFVVIKKEGPRLTMKSEDGVIMERSSNDVNKLQMAKDISTDDSQIKKSITNGKHLKTLRILCIGFF